MCRGCTAAPSDTAARLRLLDEMQDVGGCADCFRGLVVVGGEDKIYLCPGGAHAICER